MDLELHTKITPTSGDTVLARDSVTGKAVRIPTDQLGGGGSIDISGKLDKGTYTGTAQDLKTEIDGTLNKPTTTGNTTSYPFVVGEDGNGNSARLPAGDLGKNFFNSDLSNTTARNHTMNAGVTVNTLGNPHTLSGLPNKNADIANFRKVRVQNASGLDAVVDEETNEPILNEDETPKTSPLFVNSHKYLLWLLKNNKVGFLQLLSAYLMELLQNQEFKSKLDKLI